MEDFNSSPEELKSKCETLISELKDLMRMMDKKIEEMLISNELPFSCDVDMMIKKELQENFKERVIQLETNYFCSNDNDDDGDDHLKVSPKIVNNKMILILLKRKIQKLKEQQINKSLALDIVKAIS
ncbi:hypothetical protein CsatB_002022 [Cannabis sativa]